MFIFITPGLHHKSTLTIISTASFLWSRGKLFRPKHAASDHAFQDTVCFQNRENVALKFDSNTPRLYSQWLNSVIYWLINHCTDWARTCVTLFGRQFDFHDVIYHNRRRNVNFTTIGVQNVRKNTSFSLNKSCGKF